MWVGLHPHAQVRPVCGLMMLRTRYIWRWSCLSCEQRFVKRGDAEGGCRAGAFVQLGTEWAGEAPRDRLEEEEEVGLLGPQWRAACLGGRSLWWCRRLLVQEAGCWWQPLQCPTGSVGLASAASSEEWGGPGREPAPGRRVCLGRLAGWPAGRSVSCLGSHHAQRLGPTDGEGAAFCGQQSGRLCRFRGFPSQGTACRGRAGSSHHPACWPFS